MGRHLCNLTALKNAGKSLPPLLRSGGRTPADSVPRECFRPDCCSDGGLCSPRPTASAGTREAQSRPVVFAVLGAWGWKRLRSWGPESCRCHGRGRPRGPESHPLVPEPQGKRWAPFSGVPWEMTGCELASKKGPRAGGISSPERGPWVPAQARGAWVTFLLCHPGAPRLVLQGALL